MHTCFSADSEATVTSMLDAAVEKGLEGVCITCLLYTSDAADEL